MGNHFTLRSDHKPLEALFGEHKGIPQMAAGRLQRWALFLSNFNYSLKYIKGTTSKADGLSRIPVSYRQVEDNSCEYINWIEDHVPISLKMVKQETQKDANLKRVLNFLKDG